MPARQQSRIYPRRYCPPAAATAASSVNRLHDGLGHELDDDRDDDAEAQRDGDGIPQRLQRAARLARADVLRTEADTVESMDDGTRNRKLMIFSTMPTPAASVRPRRLAMTVMNKNAIWISPSCSATGTPMRRMRP